MPALSDFARCFTAPQSETTTPSNRILCEEYRLKGACFRKRKRRLRDYNCTSPSRASHSTRFQTRGNTFRAKFSRPFRCSEKTIVFAIVCGEMFQRRTYPFALNAFDIGGGKFSRKNSVLGKYSKFRPQSGVRLRFTPGPKMIATSCFMQSSAIACPTAYTSDSSKELPSAESVG